MSLVFIGFMGAGKTSAARAVAAEFGARPVDSDAVLEERFGMSIEAWFSTHSEHEYREQEEEAVVALLDREDAPVVSLGGGAITSDRVQQALRRHTVVLLDVDPDTAWQRAGGRRPLARDRRRFDELHAERLPLYERLADAILPTSRRESVRHALPHIREIPRGAKLVWAEAASGSYPVLVGDGLVGRLPEGFVVTDANVGGLYGPPDAIVIGAGEQHKTLTTAEGVLRELARRGADHDSRVVALGGGVVGDVAGFCAAVYQRGIGVVQVPTTIVAQVDSAYGGKTGVDLPEGKNYAGAYHQPSAVLADPSVLATLPPGEAAAGWAEVVKTGLIAGGALWRRVREDPPLDRDLVLACARTKLDVVASDERDDGRRQVLNLGHTIGHAIETATGYARYRHGEAVGLGLLAALTLSDRPALRADVAGLLAARGLPTTIDPAVDLVAVEAAAARDKKRRGGVVGFVIVESPGYVRTGVPIEADVVRAALQELRT
ncbi:MAG: shikimate kinase / 3-dehydroquinate synthase [Solirubrobacteraceae bacterium]|nr:shikimate kinase / 3-dehydroquinate synthase [Solirubrobacteraceae bacterium]